MEISIGSYKFRVEILIAIVIVFWIMFGHMLCSCCRVNLLEGLTNGTPGRKIAATNVYQNNNANTTETSTETTTTEGFIGANNSSMGPEFAGAKGPDYIMNPSTWSMPNLTYSPGTRPDAGVKAIWERPKQPIPLPEGQLFMFATTDFKSECCPNAYSSSTGCACMTVDQYNYLRERGGNNVPYDIF
jgi:hypothetical protein